MISKNAYWREKLTEIVHSRYIGLVREGVRIKMLDRIDLRVRWPIGEEPQNFVDGQRVIATIPAEAVRLEAGLFRRSKQRWNRWIGRIVLVEPREGARLYTVKIHGEEWTIKSSGLVLGDERAMRPWSVVNVVVDPQLVDLVTVGMRCWQSE